MTFIIEILVVSLLIATCAYCCLLSRRLKVLRAGQEELLASIKKFDEASQRAEKNLSRMQETGVGVNRDLANASADANTLINELSVMVNAGNNIASRLEGAVNEVRAIGRQKAMSNLRRAS